ncbi:Nmad5 family putative nucleotide modification protein [Rhodoplanes sp. Z2-YC6860]|uniref:Nmad5 family putative nucleotide modification protein n=1 Tax=Rhodoplanes sp. Z2-YC6860 TaxID=674703 RepID=UPI0008328BB6|nr:Nmad5 family putative nucleotide modification protein [Rhodoplanes sp. Z2-YC6860]
MIHLAIGGDDSHSINDTRLIAIDLPGGWWVVKQTEVSTWQFTAQQIGQLSDLLFDNTLAATIKQSVTKATLNWHEGKDFPDLVAVGISIARAGGGVGQHNREELNMTKRPLRAWMRDKLLQHANTVVQPAAEKAALASAYLKAVALVKPIIEKKYPPRDMRVLERYRSVSGYTEFKLQSPDGTVDQFTFEKDDRPLTPYNTEYRQIYLADARAFAAVVAWSAASDAFKKERQKRLDAFSSLVRSVSYVEDVAEVWPEAAALLPARELTAPVAPEQIAIIKADMKERKAA